MKNFLYLLFSLYLFVFQLHSVAVQASGKVPTQSLGLTLRDTTKKAKDSLKTLVQPRRDIETTVSYQAKDSIRFKVREQMIYMYGGSKVDYGKIALEAETIDMNWKTNLVKANGKLDTVSRKMIGQPVFTDQGQKYNIDAMTYNFKTKKGIITGIRTKQDEGFVVGGRVKKMPENEMFVNRGIYTTCDLPHPHYGIRARKMKVIPDKATVTGPFNLEIESVPLPLGFLFGMFPQPNRKRSGLVFPQYGETQTNGFFLQDGGFYVTFKDRVDVSLLGEIHSKGRWGLRMPINYAKRYGYTGNINLSLLRSFQEVDGRTTPTATTDFRVTWSHTPQSRGTGRFSANVNFGTNSSTRNMMLPGGNPQTFLQSSINSNINYSKTLGIFSFGIAVPYNQNIITKIINITP
ncbi:MAG: putative LPS assembly protein LptD, partial [Thermoflexibacteraceae bacterium]